MVKPYLKAPNFPVAITRLNENKQTHITFVYSFNKYLSRAFTMIGSGDTRGETQPVLSVLMKLMV